MSVSGAKGGRGGVGFDAGGASSVGFHKETRGRTGGWWRHEGAALVSTCKARALAWAKVAMDRGAVRLLLQALSGVTEGESIKLKFQTGG